MINRNTLGMIFANMHDQTVPELSADRSMGSIPFLGRYRLIDFCLSSMTNAGIQEVAVITKANYHSLMDHIGTGRPWDLSRKHQGLVVLPPYAFHGGIYHGRIEALYNAFHYLRDSHAAYVVMSDCNWIANFDFDDVISRHIETAADFTMVCKKMQLNPEIAKHSVIVKKTPEGRVTDIIMDRYCDGDALVSMNAIVVSRELLLNLVAEAMSLKLELFERDILAAQKDRLKIMCYEHEGYSDPIYSLNSYYAAQLRLINSEKMGSLFLRERPINTKVRDEAPVKYMHESKVKNCLVADGCVIKGNIENSVIFRSVTIEEGCTVKNSIIMQDTEIGAGAVLDSVITDKNVKISPNLSINGFKNSPLYIPKNSVLK